MLTTQVSRESRGPREGDRRKKNEGRPQLIAGMKAQGDLTRWDQGTQRAKHPTQQPKLAVHSARTGEKQEKTGFVLVLVVVSHVSIREHTGETGGGGSPRTL